MVAVKIQSQSEDSQVDNSYKNAGNKDCDGVGKFKTKVTTFGRVRLCTNQSSDKANADVGQTIGHQQNQDLHEESGERTLLDVVGVDAIVDPFAVVIEIFDASLALLAVVHSNFNHRVADLAVVVEVSAQLHVEPLLAVVSCLHGVDFRRILHRQSEGLDEKYGLDRHIQNSHDHLDRYISHDGNSSAKDADIGEQHHEVRTQLQAVWTPRKPVFSFRGSTHNRLPQNFFDRRLDGFFFSID